MTAIKVKAAANLAANSTRSQKRSFVKTQNFPWCGISNGGIFHIRPPVTIESERRIAERDIPPVAKGVSKRIMEPTTKARKFAFLCRALCESALSVVRLSFSLPDTEPSSPGVAGVRDETPRQFQSLRPRSGSFTVIRPLIHPVRGLGWRSPKGRADHQDSWSLTDKRACCQPALTQLSPPVPEPSRLVMRPPRCTIISAMSGELGPSRSAVALRALTRRPPPELRQLSGEGRHVNACTPRESKPVGHRPDLCTGLCTRRGETRWDEGDAEDR